MGFPIAERILESGYALSVYNRTISKAEPLKEKGAAIKAKPSAAISTSECIVLMLTDAKAVFETLFSSDDQSLKDKTVIQMGTISPSESIEIQKKVYLAGGKYLESPVLGSRAEAQGGKLLLMVGSTQERFNNWEGFLKTFGPNPKYIGEVGKASALKLALNQLIAMHAVGFSLSLGLIQKNGVDVKDFMEILRDSALYAPMYDKKLNNWINRSYDNPNFPTKHLFKDVNLILKEAEDKGLFLDNIRTIKQVLLNTLNRGFGDKDYSSVYDAIVGADD